MKQKIQVIFILILLLLFVVVIIVIVIIIVVNRTRGILCGCSCVCGGSGGGGNTVISTVNLINTTHNQNLQDQRIILILLLIILLAVTLIMFAVIWFKLSQIIHQPIVNCRNILQKYYQKYRKQFLRLCCCSYHVPPGPGPGGGGDLIKIFLQQVERSKSRGEMIEIETNFETSNAITTPTGGSSNNLTTSSITTPAGNTATTTGSAPITSGSGTNCRKTKATNRRRRSLSSGLVWLLIGLVWLEGPLLISCKMNSSGDHMIKINSNTNRLIGSDQQNKKFDILNNNKRYNKVYSKNSLKIGAGGGSGNTNNNNNSGNPTGGGGAGNGGGGAATQSNGGGGNGAAGSGVNSNGKTTQKNSYNGKNSNKNNTNNGKNNNNNNNNNNKNIGQTGSNTNSESERDNDSRGRHHRNERSTSKTENTNAIYTTNDNNNYFRYSNHYHYMDPNDQHHHSQHHHHLSDQPAAPSVGQQHHHHVDEIDKRSILASIGCPNCVFNSYNGPSKTTTAFISSTEPGTFQNHHQHTAPSRGRITEDIYNQRHPSIGTSSHLSTDMIRLESIKRQILSKLGMKHKPNVTHPLPKQFIMDTLYRADGSDYVGVNFGFHTPSQQQKINDDIDDVDNFHSDFSVNDGYDDVTGYPSDNYNYNNNNNGNSDYGGYNGKNKNFVMYNSSSNIVVDVSPSTTTTTTTSSPSSSSSSSTSSQHSQHYNQKHENVNSRRRLSPATESDLLSSHSYQYQKNNEEIHFADMEDFFGSTKEIITFAERGRMFNGHRLIEFPSPADQVIGQHLQIRSAAIWIRIETRQQNNQNQNFRRRAQQQNATNLTIWIFQLSGDDLKNKEFDDLATLSTSLNVKPNQLGWQKLDITETIRQWYGRGKSEKLRLLIDCTGCGHRYNLHLFQQDNSRHTQHQKQQDQKLPAPSHGDDDNQFFTTQAKRSNSGSDDHHQMAQHSRDHHHHHHHHTNNHHTNSYSSSSSSSGSYNRINRKRPQRNRKGRSHVRNGWKLGQSSHVRHKGGKLPITSKTSQTSPTATGATPGGSGEDVDPNRPFLVIHTDPNRARRVRRRAVDCSGAVNGQCCKESFYVSFKALGWDDWIIAPHGYFANYCRGDCGGPHRTPDTFQSYHTHVMEEFRKMDRLNGMQPCCAPLKFSSMSLIYYGNEGIIKRDLPKMVVDECGCP